MATESCYSDHRSSAGISVVTEDGEHLHIVPHCHMTVSLGDAIFVAVRKRLGINLKLPEGF